MQKKMRILTPLSNGVRWRKNVDKKIEEYIIGTRAREKVRSFNVSYSNTYLLLFSL